MNFADKEGKQALKEWIKVIYQWNEDMENGENNSNLMVEGQRIFAVLGEHIFKRDLAAFYAKLVDDLAALIASPTTENTNNLSVYIYAELRRLLGCDWKVILESNMGSDITSLIHFGYMSYVCHSGKKNKEKYLK